MELSSPADRRQCREREGREEEEGRGKAGGEGTLNLKAVRGPGCQGPEL